MKGIMLTKITGHNVWNHWHVSSSHDYKSDRGTTHVTYTKDEVLRFIFPKDNRTFSSLSFGRDRTEQAMDTSTHIAAIINTQCTYQDFDEIVGELQFCYLTGMILGNLACMEHWGHVVKVVFKAFRLTLDSPVFFKKFIKAVHIQLIYDNTGIDGSIFDHDGNLADDLKTTLVTFKSRFNEIFLAQETLSNDQKAVAQTFEEFESFLWKYNDGWDLRGHYVRSGKFQLEDGEYVDAELSAFQAEDERGEYAPAMVELDEDGREKGLIRF